MEDPATLFRFRAQRECLRVAREIVDEIQLSPETPVVTGELKRGYKAVSDVDGAVIKNPTPYWEYIEFGHNVVINNKVVGHEEAQPHVRPAIEIVARRNLS